MPALPLSFPNGDYEAKDDEAGRPHSKDARLIVNETRALVIAAMEELDRAVTSAEVYGMLDGEVPLDLIEDHLAALVKDKVAELVVLPAELHFQLLPAGGT